ncbi:MAG: universal stress protein [Dehalococcoidia bacterium]
MTKTETVMLTLDGTDFAACAIGPARQLARALDARVVLLEVLPEQRGPAPFSIEAARAADYRNASACLHDAKRILNEAGIDDVETLEVVSSSPADAIVRAARDLGCDFVVMATHGRSGLRRALKGSVAERVARRLEGASVVLVHGQAA